jgi:peptide/nickel transport system substrate-binding protein
MIGVVMQDIASLLEDMGEENAALRVLSGSDWGSYQVTFNYTCKDTKYAELFNNIKFREAMSIAVDRAKISEVLADSFLEAGQACPAEGNFGYDADWEKKWTEYNVAKAKQLLEECGLVMGTDGFYNFADGTDVFIPFYSYTEKGGAGAFPVFEQFWEAAGIECAFKEYEVAAYDGEIDNNDWYAVFGPHTSIGGLSLRDRVAPFVPIQQAAEWYGEFGTWYQTHGASGVEPTGDMAKLLDIYEKWSATPDSAERDAYTLEIYKIHKDNLWSIAYLKSAGTYNLISTKIKNYAEGLVSADLYQYANIVHYETLYKVQ